MDPWIAHIDHKKAELAAAFRADPRGRRLARRIDAADAGDLARGLFTPIGRAWLRQSWSQAPEDSDQVPPRGNGIDPAGTDAIGELDILRIAFAAELTQLDISAEQAIVLVDQGITLRDIRYKPPAELAERRWDLAMAATGSRSGDARERLSESDPFLSRWVSEQRQVIKDAQPTWKPQQVELRLEAETKQMLLNEMTSWREQARDLGPELHHCDYYDVLAVSDFHLTTGNHPSSEGLARFSPTEDFYFDDAFFRFLYHSERGRHERGGNPWELVFNGDSIDFAQIVIPKKDEAESIAFWAVPPLWEATTADGDDQAGPVAGELQRVLNAIYGIPQVDEVIARQRRIFRTARLKAGALTLAQRSVEARSALDSPSVQAESGLEGRSGGAKTSERQWSQWAEGELGETALQESQEESTRGVQDFFHWPWSSRAAERDQDLAATSWEVEAAQERAHLAAKPRQVRDLQRTTALDQLAAVYVGHRRLFQGLAWFLAQGNRMVLLRGNHDPQWYWPEVQLAFVGWLKAAYDDLCRETQQPLAKGELPITRSQVKGHFPLPPMSAEDFHQRVDFDHPWFYYRERLCYFEHGGQQEGVDGHRHFLVPVYHTEPLEETDGAAATGTIPAKASDWLPAFQVADAEAEIDPPLGSLGTVLILNSIEVELPNYERPGYDKVYMPWVLYHHPLQALSTLGRGIRRVFGAWKDWAGHRPSATVSKRHREKMRAYATLTGLSEACVEDLDGTRWVHRLRGPGIGIFLAWLEALLFLLPVAALAGTLIYLNRPAQAGPEWLQAGLVKTLLGILSGAITHWLTTWLRNYIGLGEDYLFGPSKRVAQILERHGADVPYLLWGHDHAHNIQRIVNKDPERSSWHQYYLNTGTWLHQYAKQRKRLMRGDHEYSFVRMTDTQRILASRRESYMEPLPDTRAKVELLRWNDAVGAVEPCEIFQGRSET